jgi:hypothetical protein
LISHINKHALAHVAMSRNSSRHCDFAAFGIVRARLSAFLGRREPVLERVNALGAQSSEFGFALFD